MKSRVRFKTFNQISFADMMVYSKLPQHPFWSHIESKIDFSFADSLCSVLYTGRGQHPFAPSLKLKIHLIQGYYDLPDRKTEEKIIGDLFIKRFLGLPVDFFGFDHSTIGLDRDRMGSAMFQACHFHILCQMYALGLWGDKDEQWIIDSFPSTAHVVVMGAYRLIQQGMIRIIKHLKRNHPLLYNMTCEMVALDAMMHRMPAGSSKSDLMVAFSKLAAQAYGLLYWFENEQASTVFWNWVDKKDQLQSLELQAILAQILMENSKPHESGHLNPATDDAGSDGRTGNGTSATDASLQKSVEAHAEEQIPDPLQYEKMDRKERPAHRIISAHDADARIGVKTRFKMIKGFKTQNLCTTSGVILNTKAVPASEHDRDAMVSMVKRVQDFFGITPKAILGDTAYGHGEQREALHLLGVPSVISPVILDRNPTGLFDHSHFIYDREKDVYTCPKGKETTRRHHSSDLEGTQHYFGKTNCGECPLREQCTTNKNGRTIFQSDYADVYKAAQTFNESEAGKAELKKRYLVERKNNELKNDCGLGDPRTKGLTALDIKAKIASIVINLKFTVHRLLKPKQGFLRRSPKSI